MDLLQYNYHCDQEYLVQKISTARDTSIPGEFWRYFQFLRPVPLPNISMNFRIFQNLTCTPQSHIHYLQYEQLVILYFKTKITKINWNMKSELSKTLNRLEKAFLSLKNEDKVWDNKIRSQMTNIIDFVELKKNMLIY